MDGPLTVLCCAVAGIALPLFGFLLCSCLEVALQPNVSGMQKAGAMATVFGSWLLGLISLGLLVGVSGAAGAGDIPPPEKVI